MGDCLQIMDWKKLRKTIKSWNYTIMLLPHSQKKPIQFKMPVWGLGVGVLCLFTLSGVLLFGVGSSHQLKAVETEKKQMELERQELALQKEKMEMENSSLKQVNQELETELAGLEEKTSDTWKELENLYQRENEIRGKVGLENIEIPTEETTDESVPMLPLSTAQGAGEEKLEIVKNELDRVQYSLTRKSREYDALSVEIDQAAAELEIKEKERLRSSIASYALQFVSNKYVYGGNDPNTGVDCSGFTRYVLSNTAGVSLNRTSASQAGQGRRISQSEAQPGDLIFYGNGSYINHVALYIGDGQIVHASSAKTGIKISDWNYREPVKIMNVID